MLSIAMPNFGYRKLFDPNRLIPLNPANKALRILFSMDSSHGLFEAKKQPKNHFLSLDQQIFNEANRQAGTPAVHQWEWFSLMLFGSVHTILQ